VEDLEEEVVAGGTLVVEDLALAAEEQRAEEVVVKRRLKPVRVVGTTERQGEATQSPEEVVVLEFEVEMGVVETRPK